MSDSTQPIVEAVDAAVAALRSDEPLVRDINWRVGPGEFWVIGGPHASGKTVMLNSVAGMRSPKSGTIRHFGRDLVALSEEEMLQLRTRVGFVPQGGGRMFGNLTVAENIALPLRYHRDWSEEEAQPQVAAMLEATGLAGMEQSHPSQLGAAWQMRVGLARALIMQPDILFIDEPLAGLDHRQRQWWCDFLAALTRGAPPARLPMAVLTATNDFSPWASGPGRFGLIRDRRWQVVPAGTTIPEFD